MTLMKIKTRVIASMKIALTVLGIIIFASVFFFFLRPKNDPLHSSLLSNGGISWSFNGEDWSANSTPPECPDPLIIESPVNVNLASGILYPGQVRGGDYKPHGGFRFNNLLGTNKVDVYAPMDGNLVRASRHLAMGEIQYSLYFINDCGIMFKLDHLLELTPKFQKTLETIPQGAEGDSRTTGISSALFVKQNEQIATKVGFEKSRNIFFDFGLYDLRRKNGVVYDSVFRQNHDGINEFGVHALCFLDYLKEKDQQFVKSLPAGGIEGKVSDYCN
jgi:hypothetical protein